MVKYASIEPEVTIKEITKFILYKLKEMKKDGVVIGLSGGIDSSLTASLLKIASDKSPSPFKIHGLIIPNGHDNDVHRDNYDAYELCRNLDIRYTTIQLSNVVSSYNYVINPQIDIDEKTEGNMISRIRANILSTFAEQQNLLVCGTGNFDEDYGIGYYTLFGDGAVHMSPIGALTKRLVYHLAGYINENYYKIPQQIFNKYPSARLERDQTDYSDLGYTYFIVETITEAIKQDIKTEEIIKLIQNQVYDQKKFTSPIDVIKDVLIRQVGATKKRRLVHPDVADITLNYE